MYILSPLLVSLLSAEDNVPGWDWHAHLDIVLSAAALSAVETLL